MSKRRRKRDWVGESIEFEAQSSSYYDVYDDFSEDDWDEDEFKYYDEHTTKYVEEAHEALSRLFTKTNKRSRQIRGMRRNDAWQ